MITFLAPASLAAAALLAIPIAMHVFKPRKMRRTQFSSLRWLHLTQQKLARRIKWHQVLLFALRAAFVTLLVLVAARPVFSRSGHGRAVDRLIVLDVSRSMGYQAGDRRTPMDTARQAATDLIKSGVAGDRTALFLTDTKTRTLSPLSSESAASLAAIEHVAAGAGGTDLCSALPLIRPMLAGRRADADAEIIFITDNQQGAWREAGVREFTKDSHGTVRVRVVDVGITGAQNAWIADARLILPTKPGGKSTVRVQIGCVGDSGKSRTVRLGGLDGLAEIARPVTPAPGNLTHIDIEVPAAVAGHGRVARIALEPSDALPSDDVFFLSLEPPPATKVLVVEPDDTQIDALRPGFYLRAALAALSNADDHAASVTTVAPGAAGPTDFEQADVVILADIPQLSDAATTALEARVKSGAGLAIFLGPHVDSGFYNQRLFRPLLPSESLMPAPLQQVANVPSQRRVPLTDIRWSHPLLAPLHDPVLGDLPLSTFGAYYPLGALSQDAEVLASIDGRTPAIVDRPFGTGRVVLFNTTPNDAWGDLPRRKSFVPLIDHLLVHLAGNGARRHFEIGETIVLPLPTFKPGATVAVVTPTGKILTPLMQARAGRTEIRLDDATEPGVYRVQVGQDSAAGETFVVQPGRGDSAMTPFDPATLREWWKPAEVEILAAGDVLSGATRSDHRTALWPMLAALACLALLAEMFLVHWLCPRMNPGVVAPVIRRGSLLRESDGARQIQDTAA